MWSLIAHAQPPFASCCCCDPHCYFYFGSRTPRLHKNVRSKDVLQRCASDIAPRSSRPSAPTLLSLSLSVLASATHRVLRSCPCGHVAIDCGSFRPHPLADDDVICTPMRTTGPARDWKRAEGATKAHMQLLAPGSPSQCAHAPMPQRIKRPVSYARSAIPKPFQRAIENTRRVHAA